ncbi:MAG: hypothetical protein ACJAYJ_003979 [Saprospiraceae bacterium]|jgi:hypothetical protein
MNQSTQDTAYLPKDAFDSKNFGTYHILAIVLVIYFCIRGFDKVFFTKVPKQSLLKIYQVDKKTFNKWVQHYANDLYPNFKEYLRKRKLYEYECQILIEVLGDPAEFPVMSKKEIIEQSEGSYRSLRECVLRFPEVFQVSFSSFQSMRKFPPCVSKQILLQYG